MPELLQATRGDPKGRVDSTVVDTTKAQNQLLIQHQEQQLLRQQIVELMQNNKHLDRETERLHHKGQCLVQEIQFLRGENRRLVQEALQSNNRAQHLDQKTQALVKEVKNLHLVLEHLKHRHPRVARLLRNESIAFLLQAPVKKPEVLAVDAAVQLRKEGAANASSCEAALPIRHQVNGQSGAVSNTSSLPTQTKAELQACKDSPAGPVRDVSNKSNASSTSTRQPLLCGPLVKGCGNDTKATQMALPEVVAPTLTAKCTELSFKTPQAQGIEEGVRKMPRYQNRRLMFEGLPTEIRHKIYKLLDFPVEKRILTLAIDGKTPKSGPDIAIYVGVQFQAGWDMTKCLVYGPCKTTGGSKSIQYSREQLHPYLPLMQVNKTIHEDLSDLLYTNAIFSVSYSTFRHINTTSMHILIPPMFHRLTQCTIGPFGDGYLRRNSSPPRFHEGRMPLFFAVFNHIAHNCTNLRLLTIVFSNSANFTLNKTPKSDRWNNADLKKSAKIFAALGMMLNLLDLLVVGSAGEMLRLRHSLSTMKEAEKHAVLHHFFEGIFRDLFVEKDDDSTTEAVTWENSTQALILGE